MPSNTRVLSVDDNETHRYALQRTLQSIGFPVTSVGSGKDALLEVVRGQYDAVLLDLNLPELNGFQVCAQIRRSTQLPQQPAIIFHSATDASDLNFRKARSLGADAFLTYPIETSVLAAVLLHCSRLRKGQPDHLLTTWKEIAGFLGKGVRTVQRWERRLGLPIHRPGDGGFSIFADPEELTRWALEHKEDAETTLDDEQD